jgi:hypothetical protein
MHPEILSDFIAGHDRFAIRPVLLYFPGCPIQIAVLFVSMQACAAIPVPFCLTVILLSTNLLIRYKHVIFASNEKHLVAILTTAYDRNNHQPVLMDMGK